MEMLVQKHSILCDIRTKGGSEMSMFDVQDRINQANYRLREDYMTSTADELEVMDKVIRYAADKVSAACYVDELRWLQMLEETIESHRNIYRSVRRQSLESNREFMIGVGNAYGSAADDMERELAMVRRRKEELSALLEQCKRALG